MAGQIVEIDFECCGAHYAIPTAMPQNGSMLHHATLIDTLDAFAVAQHAADHPSCVAPATGAQVDLTPTPA
jgi:hypothetical protein